MDRKLTAILYADVAGYSRLTGADDEGTVETLKVHLGALKTAIEDHGGRIVNTAGDAVLAEFASVVTALKCAVAAQRDFQERNKDLPENRKLRFRVGVNLGDVVVDGKEIYGDGVNVAARLEALADPGGICVSGRVQEQVEDKLNVGFAYLGAQSVKNIKKPVNVYKVLLDPADAGKVVDIQKPKPPRWRWPAAAAVALVILGLGGIAQWQRPGPPEYERASVAEMAFPLPDKPSIAVLPFDNLSGDPEQGPIADGITEDIITTLSRVPELFVIARNSTFTYKGKPVKVQQVAEDLGVQYVLEGSIQRSGGDLRVTAQLIDALSGRHLWADRYDRKVENLFDLQDEIARKVLIELQVKLTSGEHARIASGSTRSLEAWLLIRQAYAQASKYTKDGMLKARELYSKATEIDPMGPRGWSGLGWTYWYEARVGGWSLSREQAIQKGSEFAQRAIEVSPQHPAGYQTLANLLSLAGEHERAIALAEQAVKLAPNDFQANALLGLLLVFAGEPQRAVKLFNEAKRLSPRYPWWIDGVAGLAHYLAGQPDEAIASFKKGIARAPTSVYPRARLVAAYADLGRLDEAKAGAADLLKVVPEFTVEKFVAEHPFKDARRSTWLRDSLLKAGLPEKPPLALPDKPSIAVLPFDNLTGDPEDQFLADGLTEDIITTLSRVPDLFVIARNSTSTYKGKPVKVQQVAQELGVRYVLEGSVQRSGDRLRVTAQFIDATTGHHLWADRYDRKVDDIFALEDEISRKILIELQVKLTTGENIRVASRGTKNLEAWLLRNQAYAEGSKYSKEGMLKARELYRAAVEADPLYGRAWGGVAWTYWWEARMGGWTHSRDEALNKGVELAERAIESDPNDPVGYIVMSYLSSLLGEHDRAIGFAERAMAVAPGDFLATAAVGVPLVWVGQSERAIEFFEKAKRLSPKYPPWIDWMEGVAQLIAGRPGDALPTLRRGADGAPDSFLARGRLAADYAALDRLNEAKAESAELLKIRPDMTATKFAKLHPFKDPKHQNLLRDLLVKAGLPE